jgi:hypothetical protein
LPWIPSLQTEPASFNLSNKKTPLLTDATTMSLQICHLMFVHTHCLLQETSAQFLPYHTLFPFTFYQSIFC